MKNKIIMAVFHQVGRLDDFITDSPGIFIFGRKQIFAAVPTQQKRIFNLTLKGTAHNLALPRDSFASGTVSVQK